VTNVFVYGTLREGCGNYHRLLAPAKPVARGRTLPEFTMYHLGGFPGVVEGGRTSVVGEVFSVDDETRERLDHLEGHPTFYRRTPITLEDGSKVETYLLQQGTRSFAGYEVIDTGDWLNRREQHDDDERSASGR
jgi:gamma-glutamylaminecyclotransferase